MKKANEELVVEEFEEDEGPAPPSGGAAADEGEEVFGWEAGESCVDDVPSTEQAMLDAAFEDPVRGEWMALPDWALEDGAAPPSSISDAEVFKACICVTFRWLFCCRTFCPRLRPRASQRWATVLVRYCRCFRSYTAPPPPPPLQRS